MKSEGTFPFENRPVGIPPLKSLPYGGKLHFANVMRSLLLPVSTMESPNIMTAGTVSFLGIWMTAFEVLKIAKTKERKNNVVDEEKRFIFEWSIALGFSFGILPKFEFKLKEYKQIMECWTSMFLPLIL